MKTKDSEKHAPPVARTGRRKRSPRPRRREKPEQDRSGTDPPWDEIAKLAGIVEGPEDWAAEHDHYIHGTPKRGCEKA